MVRFKIINESQQCSRRILKHTIHHVSSDVADICEGSGLVNLYDMNFLNALLPESIGICGMRGMLTNTEPAHQSIQMQYDPMRIN